MIIPSKFDGYGESGRLTSTRRVFDSGGGGGAPASQTQVSDLPDWAKPYAQKSLAGAEALTFQKDDKGNVTGLQPYQQYRGERTAQFTPLQQKAFQGAGSMQVAPQLGMATGLAGTAAGRALGAGAEFDPYQTGQFGSQAGMYMSPFIQQALEPQMREARRQSEIQRNMDQAQAVGRGAFGGSRQAIVEAERQRNLGTQLGDIQAKGLQSAFDQARQQFNTEQQLREQSRQYGAGLGLQGLQTALTGAGQLGQLGAQQFGQQKDILGLQNQFGTQQQQQVQNILSQQYQDFLNQQRYPYQQLEFLSSMVRGTPTGQVQTMYQAAPSPVSQLAGLGTAAYGLSRMAEGGLASAYAEGGSVTDDRKVESIISKLSDAQLQQARQMAVARKDAAQVQLIDRELASRSATRAGTAGVDALPTQDMDFAGGGIVAFADGGDVERYQVGGATYETPYDRMNRLNRERAVQSPPITFGAATDTLPPALLAQYNKEAEEMGLGQRMQFSPEVKAAMEQMRSAKQSAQADYLQREQQRMLGGSKGLAPAGVTPASSAGIAAAAPISRPTEQMTPQQMEARMAARSAPSATRADAGLGGTPEAAAVRKAAAPSAGIGAPSVKGAQELAGQFLDTKAMRADLDKYYQDVEARNKDARERFEKGRPEGKAYSKYEELLQKDEAGAAKEKEAATGAAIFKAGLAMMAGGSPRAFENIGKGAMAGFEDYSSAMKDMKKAAKERQKAFADIENARRAEARDDWKAMNDFESKAEDRLNKAQELGVRGIMEITGKSADIAAGIYKTQVSEAGQTQRTNILAASRTAGAESKEIAAAEAAFARDPNAKALSKTLEMLALTPDNPNYQRALQRLNEIRASKYKEFGLTLSGAPGAGSPGGIPSDVQALLTKYGGK